MLAPSISVVLISQLYSLDLVSKVKDLDEIISKVLSISSVLRVLTSHKLKLACSLWSQRGLSFEDGMFWWQNLKWNEKIERKGDRGKPNWTKCLFTLRTCNVQLILSKDSYNYLYSFHKRLVNWGSVRQSSCCQR